MVGNSRKNITLPKGQYHRSTLVDTRRITKPLERTTLRFGGRPEKRQVEPMVVGWRNQTRQKKTKVFPKSALSLKFSSPRERREEEPVVVG